VSVADDDFPFADARVSDNLIAFDLHDATDFPATISADPFHKSFAHFPSRSIKSHITEYSLTADTSSRSSMMAWMSGRWPIFHFCQRRFALQ
jgi:hypothetical protein